jgi:ATP-dependent Clp protease protease subunit
MGGKASDIAIQAQQIVRARQRIAELIARETGKPLATVMADIDRDHWLSAEEAVDYGLVGRIISERPAS